MPLRAEVAVVTPYYREDAAMLKRALRSVARQTVPVRHFVVADGSPCEAVASQDVEQIILDRHWGDYGNTPRSIGSQLAIEAGCDAVCYLDADNWYADDHVATMLALASRGVDFVAARRHLVRPDGSILPVLDRNAAGTFVDTSCMFLTGSALRFCSLWRTMPRSLACIGDRVVSNTMWGHGMKSVVADKVTVYYTCLLENIYAEIGEVPPAGAKPDVDYAGVVDWWNRLGPEARDEHEQIAGFRLWL